MSCFRVTRIEVQRKGTVDPLKGLAQSIFLVWNRNVVDMIVHQTVCPEPNPLGCTIFGEQIKVDPPVGVINEGRAFAIAALSQMIGIARNEVAKLSRHGPSVVRKQVRTQQRVYGV
jgi:hypothetical protein